MNRNKNIKAPSNGLFAPGLTERALQQENTQLMEQIYSILTRNKTPANGMVPDPGTTTLVEIANGPENPAHIKLLGILSGLIRGNTGWIQWDNLRTNKTRTADQSWTIDPLTYDMAGQVAWAYFYGGPNQVVYIPAQNIKFRNNPNGTGPYKEIGNIRAGDYPYIIPSPEVQLPGNAGDSEMFTLMYLPNISSPADPQPPGTWQEPFRVGPVNVPVGKPNRAPLTFGFSFGLSYPKVGFFYNKPGDEIHMMPCQEVSYIFVFDGSGLAVGMQYWTDADTAISVKIEITP